MSLSLSSCFSVCSWRNTHGRSATLRRIVERNRSLLPRLSTLAQRRTTTRRTTHRLHLHPLRPQNRHRLGRPAAGTRLQLQNLPTTPETVAAAGRFRADSSASADRIASRGRIGFGRCVDRCRADQSPAGGKKQAKTRPIAVAVAASCT